MAKGSDIIKIGFDYRASLEQFEKETNGVFDGISTKAGKQRISIQLDAKNDKVIEKIKELQKLKLDKFTFEFGESGLAEQLKTFDQLEKKIGEIINLSKGITSAISKTDFGTKNKTEAYNQLKQMADAFKNFYGNEEAMHSKAGTDAAYAYYKAYEEALKKGVAQGRLEKVTVDIDPDSFYDASRLSLNRIGDFEHFKKYGGDITDLSAEIISLEGKLLDFADAYTKVKTNLGNAPITPDIIKNIEDYVELLDKARYLESFGDEDDKDIISSHRDSAQFWLDDALFKAKNQNEEYVYSLKDVREEKKKTDKVIANISSSTVNDSQFDELKADVVEIREELNGVKEKISVIDSDGFENIKSDVEKTTESVKELNSELTEIKSKLDNTSPIETNISSGNNISDAKKINEEIEKREDILREICSIQKSLTVGEDFHGNDRYFADELPTEEEIRKADTRIKELLGANNIFDVDKLIADRNRWLNEVKYSLDEYEELIKSNNQSAIDDYTSQGLSMIDGAESFFGFEDNQFSIASKFVEERERLEIEIGKLYDDLDQISDTTIKDVFQNDSDSSSTAKEEVSVMEQVESATEKVTESIKRENVELENQLKILSQVGEFYTDKTVKQTIKQNDGQIIARTYRQKMEKDDEGKSYPVFDKNDNVVYDEAQDVIISNFEKLEKTIVDADNALRKMEDTKQEVLKLDQNASTSFIDEQIEDQKQYISLLEETIKKISEVKIEITDDFGNTSLENVYEINPKAIQSAREKAAREYTLSSGAKQEKTDAKQSASDEQKRLKNIEQVNRALNKQQILIDSIEKTYNKDVNPDLDKAVTDTKDLEKLEEKKEKIKSIISELKDQDRNPANEDRFQELEKLIAEYKELAKYKLKANNPSEQKLGGTNLEVAIEQQIAQYDKLIIKAEKYGDETAEIVENLKKQRDILTAVDNNGIHTATSDDYTNARDEYKIANAQVSSIEAQAKATEQEAKAINSAYEEAKKINDALNKTDSTINSLSVPESLKEEFEYLLKQITELQTKLKNGEISVPDYNQSTGSLVHGYSKEEKRTQSDVNSALKQQESAWKKIQSIREKIAKADPKDEDSISLLKETKIEYQKQYIEAGKVLKANQDIYDSEKQVNKLKQIQLETDAKISKYKASQKTSTVSSFQSSIDSYQSKYNQYNNRPTEKQSIEYKNLLTEYQRQLDQLRNKFDELSEEEIISEDQINSFNKLKEQLDTTDLKFQNVFKGDDLISVKKEIDTITQYMSKNTRISSEAKDKLRGYIEELKTKGASANVKEIHDAFLDVCIAERDAKREGQSFLDVLRDKVWYQWAAQIGSYFSLNDIIRYAKQGIQTVRELDTALVEMRKVSDESAQSLKNYQATTFDVADAVGTTAVQIQNSTSDWLRLGYSIQEASELAKNSNIYKNVGDMEIQEATEHMISSVQAWKSEFNDNVIDTSKAVIDRYNKIGNEFAISSADIGQAMETSAAALKAGGNSLNESLGILTAANIIQQDASTTSSALKILSLRIRGAKADLEEMGESTDGLADSSSKMREELLALTGVDIMLDENTFKSTAQIIQEIGENWSKMTDVSQAATLEKLAGKNRASTVAGLIENYETIAEVIEAAENAEGSALEENEKYLDSIDGKLAQLSNRAQEFWATTINSELIKDGIDLLTALVGGATDLIDTIGTLPALLTTIGGALAFKNIGRPKMFGLVLKYADNHKCSLGY